MKLASSLLAGALALVSPAAARADTTVAGGDIADQTWTPAGSPYVVTGDLTVPSGASLTIQAGTVVQLAGADGLAAGMDQARVELTVHGTLNVLGTPGAPVTFRGLGAASWYGIIAEKGGTLAIHGADIADAVYPLLVADAGTKATVADSLLRGGRTGMFIAGGTTAVSRTTVTGAADFGVSVGGTSTVSLESCALTANASTGLYVDGGIGTTVTVTGCTLHGNIQGISARGTATSVLVKDSIITGNRGNGVQGVGYGIIDVQHTDVWGNGFDFSGAYPGEGTFSANPLFVNPPSDLRLTSNSPARFAGDRGGDVGAFPYDGVPTPVLAGTLWTDTTLAAGTHAVAGDLEVAQGVTLTLAPGAELQFSPTDLMAAGADPARSELRVMGKLDATGTAQAPIRFTSSSSDAAAWYGVEFLWAASGSTLANAEIERAAYGIDYASMNENAIRDCTVRAKTAGIHVHDGVPVLLDRISVSGAERCISYDGGGATVRSAVLQGCTYGLFVSVGASGNVALVNSTIQGNGWGVEQAGAGSVTLWNSIVAGNTYFGVSADVVSPEIVATDVWGNDINVIGTVELGAGSFSEDPRFVNAPADLRLSPGSPCIDRAQTYGLAPTDRAGVARPLDGDGDGSAKGDMGAYEYVPRCGDEIVNGTETCDDGAANGAYDHCNSTCTGPGPRCGDHVVNGAEACDDGADNGTYGRCNSTCTGPGARCGDHVVNGGETCDDGAENGTYGHCNSTCDGPGPRCGDGHPDDGEACDDGVLDGTYGHCNATCTGPGPRCGDGHPDDGEACDDGADNGTYGHCDATCTGPGPRCGDHVTSDGEQCDDGNTADGDGCSATCRTEPAPVGGGGGGGGCATGGETAALASLVLGLGAAFPLRRRRRRD